MGSKRAKTLQVTFLQPVPWSFFLTTVVAVPDPERELIID